MWVLATKIIFLKDIFLLNNERKNDCLEQTEYYTEDQTEHGRLDNFIYFFKFL